MIPSVRDNSFQPSVTHPEKESIRLPQENMPRLRNEFTYGAPNDIGRVIHTLLFCSPSQRNCSNREGYSKWFFQNLQEIGKLEGFKVQPTQSKSTIYNQQSSEVYPARDAKLRAQDGAILEPSCSSNLDKALQRWSKRTIHLQNHPSVLSRNSVFFGGGLGAVAKHNLHRCSKDGVPSTTPVRDARSYFEGGNTIAATNREGTCIYFIGEDLVTMTHMILRMDKFFLDHRSTAPTERGASYINETLIMPKYRDSLNQLYLQGQVYQKITSWAEQISSEMSDDQVLLVLNEMLAMGLLNKINFETEADKIKGREFATTYLAQREFVEKVVFPTDLRLKSEQVVALPQIAYHLDCLMTPGPEGSMFLQDYDQSVALLEKIKENAESYDLSSKDLEQLDSFIIETKKLAEELRELMVGAKTKIEAAGFTVIPTPGAFFSQNIADPRKSENINFLNAISGYSPQSEHIYFIAPGAQSADKLGTVLMDAFVDFLHAHHPMKVYFVGRNPLDPTDFSEAMGTQNLHHMTGPHCLSFELETEPTTLRATSSGEQ